MNAECARCRVALPFYAADASASEDHAFVAAHLASCAACRSELAVWRAITTAVRQPRVGDAPPADSLPRTLAAIRPRLIAPSPRMHMGRESSMSHQARLSTPMARSLAQRQPPARVAFAVTLAVILVAVVGFAALTYRSHPQLPPSMTIPFPTNVDFRSVSFATPDDGWAVGNIAPTDAPISATHPYTSPVLARYTSHTWQIVPPPPVLADRSIILTSVSMTSTTDGWAVGYPDYGPTADGFLYGVILHYTDGQWVLAQDQVPSALRRVVMFNSKDGWMVGDPSSVGGALASAPAQGWVAHYDGKTWQRITSPSFAGVYFTGVGGDQDNSWLIGRDVSGVTGPDGTEPAVFFYSGAETRAMAWVPQRVPDAFFRDVVAPVPGSAWIVGSIPGGTSPSGAANVNQPGEAAIFATGLTSASLALTQQFTSPAGAYIYTLSAISAAGSRDLWAVGSAGLIVHFAGGQWQRVATPTQRDLLALTMLSTTEGWAVGTGGTILHFTGTGWEEG